MVTDANEIMRARISDWLDSGNHDIWARGPISRPTVIDFVLEAGIEHMLCDLFEIRYRSIGGTREFSGRNYIHYELSLRTSDNTVLHSTIYEVETQS